MTDITQDTLKELLEKAEAASKKVSPPASLWDKVLVEYRRAANPQAIKALIARIQELEKEAKIREGARQRTEKYWLKAADEALAGDTKRLYLRVGMIREGKGLKIVQSDAALEKSPRALDKQ